MYHVEVTDTFAGESNYSWVHRHTLDLPSEASQRQLVHAAKAAEGWTGMRCDVNQMGDSLEIRPRGMCQVMFVDWRD